MVSTIKFSQFANGGDLGNGNTTVGLDNTLTVNTRFNNPWTFLPSGTTAQRPAPSVATNYRLRLNTDTQTYEFYDAVAGIWTELLDTGFTGVVILAPSADQTILNNHNLIMALGSMIAPTMLPGNLSLSGNAITSTNSNGNIDLIPDGTGIIMGLGSTSFATRPGIEIQKINNEVTYTAGSFINTVGGAPKFNAYKSRSTTVGVHVAVQTSDELGFYTAWGDDGTTFSQAAQIRILAGSTISSGIVSGTLQLNTASTSGVMTNALSINDSQIVSLTNPLPVASGGTDKTTFTAYSVICAGTTATGAFQNVSGVGTANQVLVSNGAGALPSWQNQGYLTGAVLLSPSADQTITAHNLILQVGEFHVGTSAGGGSQVIDIFSPTAAKGVFQFTSADNGGNFTARLTHASISASRTWTLPDATGTIALTGSASSGYVLLAPSGVQTITGFDLVVHGLTLGQGAFGSSLNTAIGLNVLSANVSGAADTGIGSATFSTLTTGNNNTGVGYAVGQNTGFGVNLTTGSSNTIIGSQSGVNNAAAVGTLVLGAFAVGDIATGNTSSDNGPGISIGSSTAKVGFRGDGSIYPGFMGTGEWRVKINDTYYKIPLLADGATSLGALSATQISFTTTSGIIGTTTNDNAAAGSVGEYQETILLSSGSLVSLSSGSATNIVQLTNLRAGDWDVWGTWCLDVAGVSTIAVATGWVSSTSATAPDLAFQSRLENQSANNTDICLPIASRRFSLASPTTIYMSMLASYTGGTVKGFGAIYARCRR